jgi:hypothetical protein
LAFAIYRSNFFIDDDNSIKIPKIHGNVYNFIKTGYSGGAVDVYIPKSLKDVLVYRYDVNSLYPYIMANFEMPVGDPIFFEGDIFLSEKDPFGFFEVEVETSNYLNHPILLMKSSNKAYNHRTIAPLGKWKGVYFSEEIKNAKKYGYKFKILRGYIFNKKIIFKNFVEKFYNIKNKTNINDPLYTVSKLILNSLYGKFGMNPYKDKHIIINDDKLYDLVNDFNVLSSIDLKNGKQLVSYNDKMEVDDKWINIPNVNIAIAAAVTSYARIFMSQFKNSKDFILYYSDTDSIDIDRPLPDSFVGKELGKMKLEHIFKEIVYIAPKVYGGVTSNKEIVKIKGAKKKVEFKSLEELLYKDKKIVIKHEK